MKAHRVFIGAMSFALMAMLPAAAAAQVLGLDLPIRVGQKVRITTDAGVKVQGRVLAMAPDTVEVGEGSGRRSSLPVTRVRRIQVVDSVENGVSIGLITFGFLAILVEAGLSIDLYPQLGGTTSTPKVPILAIGAYGALLGWAIDAARMKTVYQRADDGMSVSVRPIASAAGKGVGVRVQW